MKNQKGLVSIHTIVIVIIVFILITVIGLFVADKNGLINSLKSAKNVTLGKQFTLTPGGSATLKNGSDTVTLKIDRIFKTTCNDDGINIDGCIPAEKIDYAFTVNGKTANGQTIGILDYTGGETKLEYGVTNTSYKFDKSATFIIDTPIKTCEHRRDKIEDPTYSKRTYEFCIYDYAYAQKRVDWCQLLESKIDNGKSQENCIEAVAMLNKDKTLCAKVGTSAKGYCAVDAIIASKDIVKCSNLQGDYKYRCIQQIAKADISVCDKYIGGGISSSYCKELLKPDAVQY